MISLNAVCFKATREVLKLLTVGSTFLAVRDGKRGMSRVVAIKRPWLRGFGYYWSIWSPTTAYVIEDTPEFWERKHKRIGKREQERTQKRKASPGAVAGDVVSSRYGSPNHAGGS